MPAYNAGKYIMETINSIVNQSYEQWELIIVNDGSTDHTAQELEKANDHRIKIYHQGNKGQCTAANFAFQQSKGSIIKFMDADDLISPDFIEAQVKLLEGKDDIVISAAWGRFYNDDLSTFKLSTEAVWCNLPGHEWLVRSWKGASSMMQCALWLIPRKILEKSGLWDETLSLINDFDFFTRVLLNSKEVLFEQHAVLYYRSGISGSLSDTKSVKSIESAFKSIDQATKNLFKVRMDKEARLSCANTWQQLIYMVYPQHKSIIAEAEKRVKYFGGSDLPYTSGGWSGFLLKIFNWKVVKHLKLILKKWIH
jgi:glycosyltransferase involved in cell wall biosynthesis